MVQEKQGVVGSSAAERFRATIDGLHNERQAAMMETIESRYAAASTKGPSFGKRFGKLLDLSAGRLFRQSMGSRLDENGKYVVNDGNTPRYMKGRSYDDVAGNLFAGPHDYVASVRSKGLYPSVSDGDLTSFFNAFGNVHIIQSDILSDDYHDVKDALIELERWSSNDEFKLNHPVGNRTDFDAYWAKKQVISDFEDEQRAKADVAHAENRADASEHSMEELQDLRDRVADILPRAMELNRQVWNSIIHDSSGYKADHTQLGGLSGREIPEIEAEHASDSDLSRY